MYTQTIQVQCYSGYKADESPKRFLLKHQWIEIEEIVDRWYEGYSNPRKSRADYFKVLANDHHLYLIKHNQSSDEWLLLEQLKQAKL